MNKAQQNHGQVNEVAEQNGDGNLKQMLGFKVFPQYEKLDNIASQEELQAYVDNLKFKSLMATQEIEFSTAANPVHSAFDVIGLYKDDLTGIYEETEWSFSFTPGEPMTHRARRAIFQ